MKELLEKLAKGESTVDDVLKAIDDADKDKVPRTRLNDKIEELKEVQQQIKDRDTQLAELKTKATDSESLQAEITRLQEANDSTKTEYEQKLQQRDFDFALESALRDEKAKNPKAVKALLNIEAIKLVDGKLVGFDDQVKALRESDEYQFFPDGLKGKTPPGTPPNPNGYNKHNPFSRDTLNLTEQGVLWRENPELAKQLQVQAKK